MDSSSHSLQDKRIHTFSESISPKVNVIMYLEFELTYNDVTVKHVRHYTMSAPLNKTFKIPNAHIVLKARVIYEFVTYIDRLYFFEWQFNFIPL